METVSRFLLEGLVDQIHDWLRKVGNPFLQWFALALDDLEHGGVDRLSGERLLVGQQLVEDGPQRKDVRTHVDALRLDLLRRHVVGRAEDQATLGHVRRGQPGEAEVHQLHLLVGQHVNVSRLEVTVNDLFGVSETESVANLFHQAKLLIEC